MEMGEHSVETEYPQLDTFDPEGLQRDLFQHRFARRSEQ